MNATPPKKNDSVRKSPLKGENAETYTAEEIDALNEQFEKAGQRQIANKNSMVRLTAAERDLLQVAETIRNKLVIAVAGEKGLLAEVFGGDCSRFHRFRRVLEEVELSEMHASDQRWRHVREQMDIIEEVLKELGLYKPWVPKKKAPETLKYLGVRSRISPGDMVVLRPEVDRCDNLVFSVEPALPVGLELNSTTGEVIGNVSPEAEVGMQTYVVTVRNDGGSATFDMSFAVAHPPPGEISYPSWVEEFYTGEVVRFEPERTGGQATEWCVEPALPSGLNLSASTGVIAGTSCAVVPIAAYLVTSANMSGKSTATLQFSIIVPPPLAFSYPELQEELLFGSVAFLRPEVTLRTSAAQKASRRLWNLARARLLKRLHAATLPKMEFSIEPALPDGLILARRTGIITGVPAVKTPSTTYKVEVSNDGGSATVEITFSVQLHPPSGLAYPKAEPRYYYGQEVSLVPKVVGLVEQWEVDPELPSGLKLHARKGTISGVMPSETLPEGSWKVTARNSEGEDTVALTFDVVVPPPFGLAYPMARQFPMSALPLLRQVSVKPTVEGKVVSFAVEPPLPAGLELDPETGVLSGTATEVAERATYQVTATNETGSTSVEVALSVKVMRPEGLSYPSVEQVYGIGEDVAIDPTVQGGATAWAVEPSLPVGLELDPANGVIRGTPEEPTAAATYVVTASNEAGGTSTEVRFAVAEPAPEGLAYPGVETEYAIGDEVYLEPELQSGSIVHFSVEPALPEGLYLDPTSGIISGAPEEEASAETYVITGRSKSDVPCTVELTFACLEPSKEVVGVNQRFAEAVEEVTDVADLMEEPGKGKVLGDWMVWMVHRVHLNDPSLTELNFNNLWMPLGHMEPRIAPKLCKAIAHNDKLTILRLAHSNFQKPEGHLLADSLKQNKTLQILNVESNCLDSDTIKHMAQAILENGSCDLETWRFNNQKHIGTFFGRPVEETIGEMMEKNNRICKLGFSCNDANWRLVIDRSILRNMDFARKRRKAAGGGGREAGADGEEDAVAAEEKSLSKLILTNAPGKNVNEVFGEDDRSALVRRHMAEFKVLPTHQALQNWAKGQGSPLPYSAVKPLVEEFRAKLLNAATEQIVNVWDSYGAETSGVMRSWSEKNGSWSLDVWPSDGRRFNFVSDKQPTIEVSGAFGEWLHPPKGS